MRKKSTLCKTTCRWYLSPNPGTDSRLGLVIKPAWTGFRLASKFYLKSWKEVLHQILIWFNGTYPKYNALNSNFKLLLVMKSACNLVNRSRDPWDSDLGTFTISKMPLGFVPWTCEVQRLFISNLREMRVFISELWNLLIKMQGYLLHSNQIKRSHLFH